MEERRFPPDQLEKVVEVATVSLRGWNYPHIPRHDPQGILGLPDGGIEAKVDFAQYQEVWRFHPNGIFSHRWRMREDGTSYRGTIHFVAAIYTVAEVFEFGRRLYRDDAAVDEVVFKITLEGVLNRPGSGDSFEDLPFGIHARRNAVSHTASVSRADLAADVLSPAVEASTTLFAQLGFSDISRTFIVRKTQAFLKGEI